MDEQVKIKGVTYRVVMSETPEQAEARGLQGVAIMMRKLGRTRTLGLQRPRGRKVFMTWEHVRTDGTRWYENPIGL